MPKKTYPSSDSGNPSCSRFCGLVQLRTLHIVKISSRRQKNNCMPLLPRLCMEAFESSLPWNESKPCLLWRFCEQWLTYWRVRWKKGVRIFTQKWTLSETLQIPHAVLFTWVKQCSACFFPEVCFLFEIISMQKTHFSKAILWEPFVERKTKEAFSFAKPWSQYNTWISYYCFVGTSG